MADDVTQKVVKDLLEKSQQKDKGPGKTAEFGKTAADQKKVEDAWEEIRRKIQRGK